MPDVIPDLWKAGEDAEWLYQLYLARLWGRGKHERVVQACRQIRRYAARGPGVDAAYFTQAIEQQALFDLGRYKEAWRRLRDQEVWIYGRRLDLKRRRWPYDDHWPLIYHYSALLYFMGRYRQGCELREKALRLFLNNKKVSSYELMFQVINDDQTPSSRPRVTLSHFYHHLGKSLDEWKDWRRFVLRLHPRLFRLAGISQDELLGDASLLPAFFGTLKRLCRERSISGMSYGLSDLIDSPKKVKKRQLAEKRKQAEWERKTRPRREAIDAKLRELFPELKGVV